jgi:hypothetical protein
MGGAMKRSKSNCKTSKDWPDDLGKPIVIPFRAPERSDDDKVIIHLDGLPESLDKLMRLAHHYGIKREGTPGWGLLLAFAIARDVHPGFRVVYDDRRVTLLNRRHGLSLPTLEGDRPHHRPKGTGWQPDLFPETVALLVDTFGKRLGRTDRKVCELIVCSFEPELGRSSRVTERNRRINTVIRRLSEGRKLKKGSAKK